jgi:hypothetical protein
MFQNDITDLPRLRNESYENIFQVYTDEEERYYYNILQTVSLPTDLPEGYFFNYTIKYGDTWPFISYKAYRTPNLWWVILPFNNIIDPTKMPELGSSIKILKTQFVKTVLNQISVQQGT